MLTSSTPTRQWVKVEVAVSEIPVCSIFPGTVEPPEVRCVDWFEKGVKWE
jgi:hypothetical protein